MMRSLLFVLSLALCCAAAAQQVYKVVGPDGKVTYSQTPPPPGSKLEKTLEFQELPSTPMPDYVLKFRQELEKSIDAKQKAQAEAPQALRLFTAKWCGYCRQAKGWLSQRGMAFQEVDIETPGGMAEFARTGGRRSVPLLIGPGLRLQGFSADGYAQALAHRRP